MLHSQSNISTLNSALELMLLSSCTSTFAIHRTGVSARISLLANYHSLHLHVLTSPSTVNSAALAPIALLVSTPTHHTLHQQALPLHPLVRSSQSTHSSFQNLHRDNTHTKQSSWMSSPATSLSLVPHQNQPRLYSKHYNTSYPPPSTQTNTASVQSTAIAKRSISLSLAPLARSASISIHPLLENMPRESNAIFLSSANCPSQYSQHYPTSSPPNIPCISTKPSHRSETHSSILAAPPLHPTNSYEVPNHPVANSPSEPVAW